MIPKLKQLVGRVDMVFIDHAKNKYLSDLLLIEKVGLLRHDAIIVANSVIIFKVRDYLQYVRNSNLYKSSVTHTAPLEYDYCCKDDIIDGVEISVWKGYVFKDIPRPISKVKTVDNLIII